MRRRQTNDTEIDALQARVNGTVRLKLFKGEATIVECRPARANGDHRGREAIDRRLANCEIAD